MVPVPLVKKHLTVAATVCSPHLHFKAFIRKSRTLKKNLKLSKINETTRKQEREVHGSEL